MLKAFGPPQKVAASYAPEGQYLIGPALFPFFRFIAGIVLAAVIGAQLLAVGIAVFIGEQPVNPLETLASMLTSIPAAIGSLVIVFAILQRFDVHPELDDEPWDPQSLPVIEETEIVKRGERIFGIVMGSVLLAVLTFFPEKIGVYSLPQGEFFVNPVILENLGWLILSLLAGIGLDIYLLWQGRWTTANRIARIAVNLLGIAVLAVLLEGHNVWLAARGAVGFLPGIGNFAAGGLPNWQLIGMQAFRMAFGVALVVITIETTAMIFRLLRSILGGGRKLKMAELK
jgi:hypothetical protein